MSQSTILDLAEAHGLQLQADGLRTNEAGLDYRVVFGVDDAGTDWVLRIPRRADVSQKIADEARILDFVRGRISAQVPDWRIQTAELIAYPLLPGEPGLTLNEAGEPVWHFDTQSTEFAASLGRLIGELHQIDAADARAAGIPVQMADEVRTEWRERFEKVTHAFSVAPELADRWKAWLDDDGLWPKQTAFTHGELYPAHLLLGDDLGIRSVLDWTTAKVSDPALDFVYQWMIAEAPAFQATVDAYEAATGTELTMLQERCEAIMAASPMTYADFALTTGDAEHLATAATQLSQGAIA